MIVDGDIAEHLDADESRWRGVDDIVVSWRGGHGYLTAVFDNGDRIRLARIDDIGDDGVWEFALYEPATESYLVSRVHTGAWQGTIAEVIDTAAMIHLTGLGSDGQN